MLANSWGPDVETINQWSASREKLSSKETRTPCRQLFAELRTTRTWEFGGCFWQPPGTSATLSIYRVSVPVIGSSTVRELLLFHFCVYQGTSAYWHGQWCLNSNPVPSNLLYLITDPLFLTTLCGFTILLRGARGIQGDASGTLSGRRAKHKMHFEKRVPIFQCLKVIWYAVYAIPNMHVCVWVHWLYCICM